MALKRLKSVFFFLGMFYCSFLFVLRSCMNLFGSYFRFLHPSFFFSPLYPVSSILPPLPPSSSFLSLSLSRSPFSMRLLLTPFSLPHLPSFLDLLTLFLRLRPFPLLTYHGALAALGFVGYSCQSFLSLSLSPLSSIVTLLCHVPLGYVFFPVSASPANPSLPSRQIPCFLPPY